MSENVTQWKDDAEWDTYTPAGESHSLVRCRFTDKKGRQVTEYVAVCTSTNANNSANAQLFAAAPAMYHACEVIKRFLDSLEDNFEDNSLMELRKRIHAPLHNVLDTAMRKARL